jgi:uncharacterized membrane protein
MTVPTGPEAGSRVNLPKRGIVGPVVGLVVEAMVELVVVVVVVVVVEVVEVVEVVQCRWPLTSLPCGG